MSDALVQRLQSMGYLSTATQSVRADVTHRIDDLPSLEEIELDIDALSAVVLEGGGGESETQRIAELKEVCLRAKLARDIAMNNRTSNEGSPQ